MIDLIQYYLSILLFIALLTVVTILAIETLRSDKTSYFTNFIKKHIAIVLFISALFVSFISFDEYGISWDETASRKSGRISYEYITSNNQELIDWQDRDYGVAFELPLYILEKVLNLADPRRIYLMRHLIINTFYLISALTGYLLAELVYKKKSLAVITFLLIVLHPRIYTHSFFNIRDIPFMAMFLICLFYIAISFQNKSIKNFLGLGICVGLLLNLRLMGLLIFFLIIALLFYDLFIGKEYRRQIELIVLFTLSTMLTLYISWPFLWNQPVKNLIFAMNNMAQARYSGFVLFNGVLTRAADLGISYFPKWFIISTPIPYLLFGLFGLVLISWRLIRKPIKFLDTYENRLQFIFAVCFGAPIALILIFNPILYDGWRHLYFVYPPFVFLCIYGVNYIIEKWGETIPYMILVITFGFIITFMYNNFPLQYVYFNRLVNTQTHDHLRYQYDLEYWGISYKQCLEYILENDQSKTINVFVEGAAGRYNLNILPNSYRDRIRYVDIIDAKYVITNLRTNPIGFEEFQNKIWHSIQVGNNTVAIIYKIHE